MQNFRLPTFVAASVALGLLAGCGSGVSGTYTNKTPMGDIQYTFKNGTLTISTGGMSQSGYKYKVDGKKIILSAPSGGGPTLELQINDKGCITGPMILGEACKS
jgi:hypothetical protein